MKIVRQELSAMRRVGGLPDEVLSSVSDLSRWEKVPPGSLVEHGDDVRVVSLARWTREIFIQASTHTLFGKAMIQLNPGLIEEFFTFDDRSWMVLYGIPLPWSIKMKVSLGRVQSALRKYLELPQSERDDASKVMKMLESSMREGGFQTREMPPVLSLIYWGFNTNAWKACFWCICYIVEDRDLLKAIREEVLPIAEDEVSPLDLSSKLKSCAKLNSVYHEVLRFTAATGSARKSLTQRTLGGKSIASGTDLVITYREILMSEDIFGEDAASFRWDRFLHNDTLIKNNAGYTPFGGGVGQCPGRFLAQAEILSLIALTLTRYDLEIHDENRAFPSLDTKTPSLGMMGPKVGEDLFVRYNEEIPKDLKTMDPAAGFNGSGNLPEANEGSPPIFDVKKVDMQFSIASEFVAAQVANNVLIIALQTGRIMRIDLDNPADIDDIDLPRKPAEVGTIRRLFIDPTASHLIVSTTLGENYYLHMQSKTPKELKRLRGVIIECISWNPSQPTASTREILVGATDGKVYETFLELSNEFYRRDEKFVKNVYQAEAPICGIWTDQLPGRLDLRRVIIATNGRLLHFVGKIGRHGSEGSGSIFTRLFETESPRVHEVGPATGVAPSNFVVTPDSPEYPGLDSAKPERIFAWLSSQGLTLGKLILDPADPQLGDKLFRESRWRPKSAGPQSRKGANAARPHFVALTQWHVVQVIDNRVVATNRLDDSVVYDQAVLPSGQQPLALLADLKKNTFWLFTSQEIFEIEVQDEDRDIWKVMMKAQRFEEALQYANNSAQKDAVATASGDYLIDKGQYMEAAGVYGKSTKPFEQVSLAFLDKSQRDALRRYLMTKLAGLKKTSIMQRIMLASWLVELLMAKLDSLDDMLMTEGELTEDKKPADIRRSLSTVQKEYEEFVRRYKDDLDRKTVYDIISSHGREEELLYFSTAIGDYNYILSHWVQRSNWPEALKALAKQTSPEVFYKFSTVLIEHSPAEFTDIIMRQTNLDPGRLIPACLNYNEKNAGSVPQKSNQAIRYLLFCINNRNSTDPAVHNTLISIYATHPSHDESALLHYLESQSPPAGSRSAFPTPRGEKDRPPPYDPDFALRLCIQHARVRSCVHIYTTMGQHVPAVELALQHGETDVAVTVAEGAEHDQPTRKKLWLTIAKSVISGETSVAKFPSPAKEQKTKTPGGGGGPQEKQPKGLEHRAARKSDTTPQTTDPATIQTALSLLRRAPPGTLRIEDLLPLFPDFLLIDAFKPEITSALQSYSSQIDSLKRDMDDSARTAAQLREEEERLDERWMLLKPGEGCGVCGEVLLERRFWCWGCGHGAHVDCVARSVARWGSRGVARRVREIKGVLERDGAAAIGGGGGAGIRGGAGAGAPAGSKGASSAVAATAGPSATTTHPAAGAPSSSTTTTAKDQAQTHTSNRPLSKQKRAELVEELDEICGRECVVCWEGVRLVDEPFVNVEGSVAERRERDSWAV
ncbi:MAG: hypothetical protein M1831_003081 [Alyxoria varia]|nr:MAG: hypothetical protein M1831_003081 [Alyxoria varia]